jgi:transposase
MTSIPHHHSYLDKARAMGMLMAGKSKVEVGKEFEVSRNTIYRWKKQYDAEKTFLKKPRKSTTRVGTEEQTERLIQFVLMNPDTSAAEAKKMTGFPGSIKTIRKRIADAEIKDMVQES